MSAKSTIYLKFKKRRRIMTNYSKKEKMTKMSKIQKLKKSTVSENQSQQLTAICPSILWKAMFQLKKVENQKN